MASFGAGTVVSSGQVLLIRRKDFEVWSIPAGGVEDGETAAQAAIRETREETGIEVRLSHLVGIYSSPRWHGGGDHMALFAAEPVGGRLEPQPEEVLEVGYFPADQLPEPFVWWHRRRIADALRGARGVACAQDRIWPFDPGDGYREIFARLKESGLTPGDFFLKHMGEMGPEGERGEVG